MARKEISPWWDRENRNSVNENFIELYTSNTDAKEQATQALGAATAAGNKADQALDGLADILATLTTEGSSWEV